MNAQIIEKNGKPEWAVIPYGEFIKIQEILEDVEDIKDIEENREMIIPGEVTFVLSMVLTQFAHGESTKI